MIKITSIEIKKPEEISFIFGQSHFIKTVEDLHEALVVSVPGIKFGLAFCEASGPCLIRTSGTDEKLIKLAEENALRVACGHAFLIFLDGVFPINVLSRIRQVDELVTLFCATANPTEVLIGETEKGRSVMGVVDGSSSKGVESDQQKQERKAFLRKIGYKL